MKTAKPPPPPAEPASNRRSQPIRQTRTNPQRTSSGLKRTLTRDSLTGAAGQDRPIDIFPAITHFADTMTSLPKELVKHFTLLKEVDAKVHLPQESLFRLIDEALGSPMPEASRSSHEAPASALPASMPMSTQNSSSGTAVNGHAPAVPSAAESSLSSDFASSDIRRRQLFRQVAFEIKEMLVSLEEKNHVIATANEALQKQLARIDDVWTPLENEFSDEAKWGSTTHWAYQENRAGRADNAQAERSRREGAASLSAAAQKIAEEMAQRSDSRKQAMAMKRSLKTQQLQESDFDDHEGKKGGESGKKAGGAKSRKPQTDVPATVGLGISNVAAVNGNPPAKRRKVEKPTNDGASMERAMSSVFGSNGAKPKPNSPRETPVPDTGAKKRKALPGGTSQAKKSRPGNGMSPSVTSSPVVATFADAAKVGRNSPVPSGVPRPVSSRARQTSTQPNTENPKPRPSSAASNKVNGVAVVLPELAPQTNGARILHDKAKEIVPPPKPEVPKPADLELPATTSSVTTVVVSRKEPIIKTDEIEAKKEKTPTAPVMQTITTKSGRASKPSTPALATFAEAARSRLSRASDSTTAKRSHKKQASIDATALTTGPPAQTTVSAKQVVEEEDPLYCNCNTVSYGEMIACDGQGCVREWFHLECVGLKVAPKRNTKWYCEDCKKRLKVGERKSIGR